MISSGVLAFYLSENEDPGLWRAMAQFNPDERAEFFRRALNYLMVLDEESMYAADSRGNVSSPSQQLFASKTSEVSPAHREPKAYTDNRSYGDSKLFANSQPYDEDTAFYRDSGLGASAELQNDRFEDNLDSDRSNQIETPGKHTLTSTFSQYQPQVQPQAQRQTQPQTYSQAQPQPQPQTYSQVQTQTHSQAQPQIHSQMFSNHEQLRKMYESSEANREMNNNKTPTHKIVSKAPNRDRRPAESVVQPEIRDVSLNDIFSDTAAPNNDILRGRDFLLKNVIGEENDEAVMEAIRRRKAASSR